MAENIINKIEMVRSNRNGNMLKIDIDEAQYQSPYTGKNEATPFNRNTSYFHKLRGKELDEQQFAAAQFFNDVYESVQIGRVKTIDFTKERVDGGGSDERYNFWFLFAMTTLHEIKKHTPDNEYVLLVKLAGECQDISKICGTPRNQREEAKAKHLFIQAVENLSQLLSKMKK